MKKISLYIFMLLMSTSAWYSCETEDHYYDGPERFSFTQKTSDFMLVTPDGSNTYTIEVGSTTVSDSDRTLKFKASDKSTAIAGEHYILPIGQAIIPAGKYIGTLEVKANFSGFTNNDAIELVIEFADEHATLDDKEFAITMQRMCPLDLDNLVGTYTVADHRMHRNGNDWRDIAYEATVERISGKDDQLKIKNLGGYGGEIIISLDISAVNIIPVSFEAQMGGYDPELFNETGIAFGDVTISDRKNSTILTCDEVLKINLGTTGSPGFYSLGTATFTKK